MAKKTFQYIKKDTKANTEYRELQKHDKKYVMDKLRDIIEIADGIKDKPEYKDIHWQIIRPNSKLPRQGTGHSNSIYRAVVYKPFLFAIALIRALSGIVALVYILQA